MNKAPAPLDRAAILAADDLPLEKIHVPEWGGHIYVRTMTGAERDAWETELIARAEAIKADGAGAGTTNARAWLASYTVVDAAGNRLFGPGDVAALGAKSAKALDRIYDAASRLNGLSARDLEDLEKN